MTLKFDGSPWKTIAHLFYANLSFVHHSIAIGQIKLELQSGNAKFGSKSMIFVPCDLEIWRVTFKNNSHIFYATSSFSHHFIAMGKFKLQLQSYNTQFGKIVYFSPCDLEIWRMTLERNRAPHLTYFKLCASFHSHRSIQTLVTVRKRQIRVKIGDLPCPVWPWNLTDDLEKQQGTYSMVLQAVCMVTLPYVY